jgi:cystathionine beta-lyase
LASRAAFAEGDAWRASAVSIIDRNASLLEDLLREHVPGVTFVRPRASYLAWLDCRALGLGDDPAKVFLARGKVALSPGPPFGTGGNGYARLNVATTRTLLEEAVRRIKAAVFTR